MPQTFSPDPDLEHTSPAPHDWSITKLDEVAKRGSGHTPKKGIPEYWNGEVPWISLQDSADLDHLFISATAASITPAGIANSSAKLHPAGTVVLSRDAGVGKSTIMAVDMAVSQHFIAWTCGPRLHNVFLYYYLQSQKGEFDRIAIGSTIKTIGLPYFRDYMIPLPPLAEQEAIAEALSDADALIEGLERLITKKRLIKQGTMQDLLTGRRRLPGFSEEWKPLNLASRSHLKARIGWQGLTTQEYRKFGEHILVTGTDIVSGRVNWPGCVFVDKWRYDQDRNIQLRDGDILLTKDGTIGKVARVLDMPGPAALNSGVFVIRPKTDEYHPGFAFHILSSSVFNNFLAKLTAGSTIVHLYQKDLVTFDFLAPRYKEQLAISDSLDDMDAEIQALEARLKKARQIKEGMMQNLLTGRIRLV